MIKSVTVINHLNEVLLLNLTKPDDSGFEVHDIQGLGPVKATINSSKTSTLPGVTFNSATVDGRNIVMQLGFLNAPTVEEARQRSYRYFPVAQEVTLLIQTDTRLVTTYGRVESNEPVIFSKDNTTQISIVCDDAYLYAVGENSVVTTTFYGVEGGFEFPFSNESLTEPLIEFGTVQSIFEKEIEYVGDGQVGMAIKINIFGPVTGLTIYNPRTNEAMRISSSVLDSMTGDGLLAGDEIIINTNNGQKSAYLLRNGIQINILNTLGRNIQWLKLQKGINTIAYTATSGIGNAQIKIESLILYEGV